MGGTVTVTSKPNQGTTFTINFKSSCKIQEEVPVIKVSSLDQLDASEEEVKVAKPEQKIVEFKMIEPLNEKPKLLFVNDDIWLLNMITD